MHRFGQGLRQSRLNSVGTHPAGFLRGSTPAPCGVSMGRFDFFMGHMAFCHGAFRFAHGADSCRQWGKLDLPISSDPFAICRIPCRTLRTCRPPRQDRHQVSVTNLKVALPFWILALPFLKMALTPFSPDAAPSARTEPPGRKAAGLNLTG